MKTKIKIGLLYLAVLMACSNPDKSEQSAPEGRVMKTNADEVQLSAAQVKNAGIQSGKLESKAMHSTIQVNGVVDVPPENTYSVSVPMGGYIKKMMLIPGMMVKKGAVLATVEDQQYIQLQQDYLTSKNKLQFASADYNRQKGLNQTKATSDKVFQQTESEFNNQKVLVKSLAEKLRLIGINPLTLNEDHISRSISIFAPISGYVTKVNTNAGKYVNASDVLFELIRPGALHASLTVFERDAVNLKLGQEIVCTTTANPDKKYLATIHLITPNIEGDRTTSIHCDLEQTGNSLLPGTFLNASISVSNAVGAAAPDEAIVKWENRNYVFEDLGDHRYKMIPIETGASLEGFTEIKSAYKPVRIVTKNAYAILMKMKNSGEEG